MAHHDPRLLFSVKGIKAYHIQQGEESDLTPSGPQTLSLLMVPTEPYGDRHTGEEDFYLHLNLPPELDLSLPATTQIYHQPPRSYLIPRWDLGPDSGAFTRIEFPNVGRGVSQEDIDTFETILAQCTAFLERAAPPAKGVKGYNPSDFKPGEGYVSGTGKGHAGQIVLVDEDNGSVVGEVAEGATIIEEGIKPGQKDPVEIEISSDGKRIQVKPLSEDYLEMARLPQYRNSSLVQNAAAASRLIVTTSSNLANMLTSGAETFTAKTKPQKPITFQPATHNRVRKINGFTAGAASFSSKTVGQVSLIAQNIGGTISGRTKKDKSAPNEDYKPGLLNKSMIAFSTIADGIAASGKHILTSSGAAATAIVGHRYGEDARQITSELTSGVTNVGLVYIDVTGVSRRAVIKSVAKGMVVGRVPGGGQVVVGGGDGGEIPPELRNNGGPSGASYAIPTPPPGASGSGAPPSYTPGDYKPTGLPEKYS